MFEIVCKCRKLFEIVRKCLKLFEIVWTCLNLYEIVWNRLKRTIIKLQIDWQYFQITKLTVTARFIINTWNISIVKISLFRLDVVRAKVVKPECCCYQLWLKNSGRTNWTRNNPSSEHIALPSQITLAAATAVVSKQLL